MKKNFKSRFILILIFDKIDVLENKSAILRNIKKNIRKKT